MRVSAAVCCVALCLLILTQAFPATNTLPPPPASQTFAFATGQQHDFAFPITAPGAVHVALDWKGVALSVGLAGPDGKRVGAAVTRTAPHADLTYNLTQAQVTLGPVWSVDVVASSSVPGGAPGLIGPAATVTVTIKAPVDPNVLQTKLQALANQRSAALAAVTKASGAGTGGGATPMTFDQRVAASNKLLAGQFSALTSLLTARMKSGGAGGGTPVYLGGLHGTRLKTPMTNGKVDTTVDAGNTGDSGEIGTVTVTTGGQGTSGKGRPVIVGLPGDGNNGDAGVIYSAPTPPVVVSLTPAKGSPGDEIKIRLKGGAVVPANNQVTFVIAPGLAVAAPILSTTGGSGYVDLTVAVPYDKTAASDYPGNVVIKDDRGDTSPAAAFQFTALPLPAITGAKPFGGGLGPGECIAVVGRNFTQDTGVVFFRWPSSPQSPVQQAVPNGGSAIQTTLFAGIPPYQSVTPYNASIFVRVHYKSAHLTADLDSADFPITLDPDVLGIATINGALVGQATDDPQLAALQAAIAAGQQGKAVVGADWGLPNQPVLLGGAAFRTQPGLVHFVFAGHDYYSTPKSWSDTQILVNLPDYSGIAGPTGGSIYIVRADGVKSASVPFAFLPLMVAQRMSLSRDLTLDQLALQMSNSHDKWSFTPDGMGLTVAHDNSFWSVNYGDDRIFSPHSLVKGVPPPSQWLLRNGWTVTSVDVEVHDSEPLTVAKSGDRHVGTTNPGFDVGYVIAAGIPYDDWCGYTAYVTITGPRGVPYK